MKFSQTFFRKISSYILLYIIFSFSLILLFRVQYVGALNILIIGIIFCISHFYFTYTVVLLDDHGIEIESKIWKKKIAWKNIAKFEKRYHQGGIYYTISTENNEKVYLPLMTKSEQFDSIVKRYIALNT